MNHRQQLTVLALLVALHAMAAFASYAFFAAQLAASAGLTVPDLGVSNAVLGLANAGIVLVVYGVLGLAGYGLARRLGLPGFYRQGGTTRSLLLTPLLIGAVADIGLVAGDILFAPYNGIGPLAHPPFPVSILAALSAGIGEELLFRGFVLGLWALLLTWLLRRAGGRRLALWSANLIAAVAFAASHLGAVLVLTGATSVAALSPWLLVELLLLNGDLSIVAGQQVLQHGLVAAAGIHFWADIVFHVGWGLIGRGPIGRGLIADASSPMPHRPALTGPTVCPPTGRTPATWWHAPLQRCEVSP